MKIKLLFILLPLAVLVLFLPTLSLRQGGSFLTNEAATDSPAGAAARDFAIPSAPPAAPAGPAPERVVAMAELPPSPDVRWQKPSSLPPMADFQKWVARPPDQRDPAVGVKLAQDRRAALRLLIEQDPAQAIANAVPESVRRTLPAAVRALLEERVDGRGDLMVTAISDEHAKQGSRLVRNTVTLHDGREFEAFVYGNREYKPSRGDIPLHGIALDGKMAVSEWPGRVLEPVEISEAKQAAGGEPVCSVSKQPVAETGTETALLTGNQVDFYCGPAHARSVLHAAAAAEAVRPPGLGVRGKTPQVAASDGAGVAVPGYSSQGNATWTTGTKRLMVARVRFADGVGYHNLSDADSVAIVSGVRNSFAAWSYGRLDVLPVQADGSVVAPVITLNRDADKYTGDEMGVIWKDVRDKLVGMGYVMGNYDFLLVLAGNAPFTDPEDAAETVTWSGIGQVGAAASLIRLNNSEWTAADRINRNISVSLHEIGHNLGLYHASNVWDPSDIGFLGNLTGAEYGDRYDRMGTGGGDFNARLKQWLNWLDDENLPLGTTAGTYLIREHDQDEKSGARGLQLQTGDGFSFLNEYFLFVEYRLRGLEPDPTTPYVPWSDTLRGYGAQIRLGSPYSPKSWLLDATPETPNNEPVDPVTEVADTSGNVDSPLLPGRTFAFTRNGRTVYLTNLQADPNTGLLEVEVQHGPLPGNDPPSGSIGVSTPQGAVDQNIIFTANATDPEDASLAYHWEIPRFDVSSVLPAVFPNAQSITVKFPTIGSWEARCIVSDKHGGTVTLTRSFSVVANSPPTLSAISDRSFDEDASLLNLPFTVGDATTPAASLTVSVASSNIFLFPFNTLTLGGSGANRTLSMVPPANRNGTATVTVSVYDGELVTVEQFLVTVRAVTPGSTLLASGSSGWRYWAQAAAPAAAWFTTAYNDTAWGLDSSRFIYPAVPFQPLGWTALPGAAGRTSCYFRRAVTMPPLPNGAPMLRLLCDDGAIVYVNGVEVYRHNLPAGPVTAGTLALASVEGVSESAWTTVPLSGSSFINGTSNLIAVEVHDAGGPRGGGDVCFDLEFGLRQAPLVSSIGRQTSAEDQVAGPYNFTASDFESPGGQVWVTGSSSNQALVLDTGIKMTHDVITGQRTIRCTPQPNVHGSTVIAYKVSDGMAETWRSFTLTVTPVNDPPEIVPLPDMAVALGEIPPLVAVTVGDADADPGSLAVTASASGVLGLSTVEVLPGPSPSTRWLRLMPESGMAAQANVTLSVTDGNTTTTDSFIFRVTLPFSTTTTEINFIKSGDPVWRYWHKPLPLDGQGNPVNFTAPDFDHSSWASASTQAGYGDGGDPTSIPIYPLRITTYFRAKFTVLDPT